MTQIVMSEKNNGQIREVDKTRYGKSLAQINFERGEKYSFKL